MQELNCIRQIWLNDKHEFDDSLPRIYEKVTGEKFIPTEIGIETTDKLQEYFKDIINVDYTKAMEDDLDKIAGGGKTALHGNLRNVQFGGDKHLLRGADAL